jgi:hypothetical protein
MSRKIPALLFALVVVFLLATLTVLFLLVGRTSPAPPLPNPNGYDDFLKAAAVLTGDVGNASALDHDGLKALVSTNSESLRLLRLGLTRGCSLPTESAMTNISGLLSDLANLKSLVRLLEEEGRLAEMENRYGDAAHSYVDAIRFGNEISRGAFIINRLVGIACEAIGENPLAKLVPKLKRRTITLVTTLSDPKLWPVKLLAALYHRLWKIELYWDDIKTVLLQKIFSRLPLARAHQYLRYDQSLGVLYIRCRNLPDVTRKPLFEELAAQCPQVKLYGSHDISSPADWLLRVLSEHYGQPIVLPNFAGATAKKPN